MSKVASINFDFEQIASITSIVRLVGHGFSLVILPAAFFLFYKNSSSSQCQGSNATACDIGSFIFFYVAAIVVSDFIGLPWDIFALWAIHWISDVSLLQ